MRLHFRLNYVLSYGVSEENSEVVEASGMMKYYVNAITKTAPKA